MSSGRIGRRPSLSRIIWVPSKSWRILTRAVGAFPMAKTTWRSEKMAAAVNAAGGSAKLTIYPEAEHDAWTPAYSDPELYRWFLSNVNEKAQ